MSLLTPHFRKSTWNALLRVLIVFAFAFSTPVLAGANVTPMAQHMQVGATTNSHIHEAAEQGCEHMDMNTSNDCCEDENEGDVPCRDGDGCKTVCTGMSISPAVLGTPSHLRHFSTFVRHAPHQVFTHGINPQLGAPPPRA